MLEQVTEFATRVWNMAEARPLAEDFESTVTWFKPGARPTISVVEPNLTHKRASKLLERGYVPIRPASAEGARKYLYPLFGGTGYVAAVAVALGLALTEEGSTRVLVLHACHRGGEAFTWVRVVRPDGSLGDRLDANELVGWEWLKEAL